MNLSMKQKQTHRYRENRFVFAKRKEVWGRMDWEFGTRKCKLLYTEWINKALSLYSTGKYTQYPVINQSGQEYEKEYIWITESLCCTTDINTL